MFKSKFLRSGLVMFLFGTFGLFSCSQTASVSTNVNPSEQTGSVEVTLPNLSSGALSKSAVILDTNSLNLIITGANMDTIKYSWPMYSLKGQRVQINGIPAGTNRYFSGFLTDKRGIVTHTGKVAATITPGIIVPVTLKLSATGSVDLCIEIEGYPTSCNGVDTIIINTCAKVSGLSVVDGKISLSSTPTYANGCIEFNDSIYKRYFINKFVGIKDNGGQRFYTFQGYCKETGINAMYEMIIKGNTVSIGYIYNIANNQLIHKFYSTECTQPDTLVLSGLLNAYFYPSGKQDTGVAKFQMTIYNGRANGYLSLYNAYDKTTLNLSLNGTSNFNSDQQYGDINVSGVGSDTNSYTLRMSFGRSGELFYCKGSLDRKDGVSIATIYGDL
jgi:hypothetical protein